MSLPTPSIVDRTKNWLKLLKRQSRSPPTHADPAENTGASFFPNAQDFTVNGGNFINELKINYINDVVSSRQAVFELLEPYACLDATKDSSARHPPPRCHPQTRLKIRERLIQWVSNEDDEWRMLWVRGSAGTGKSAVAQSFGDSCGEEKHGASYFFSRTASRNKPETVVPTLVYQLATADPEYRSLIGHQLANNPLLLRNSPPVQFRKLIVEPFSSLQRQRPRKTVVIILDGLDECTGEDAQLGILDMITNALRTNPDLPLRWLIFSRPEAHLKDAFTKYTHCGREELVIDAECRDDVERYTRDGISQIKEKFKKFTPADWPSADQLEELIDRVSGLFVYASTCLNFIGDRDEANPQSQLNALLMFMHRAQGVVAFQSPVAALDLLYSRILEGIPPAVFNTTSKILAYMCYRSQFDTENALSSAQALCNFLRLDEHTFFRATRGLHSVMNIPEPGSAAESQLEFYHASFQDFLLDPNRSGHFVIREQKALVDSLQLFIYWYDVDVTNFHLHGGWKFDDGHKHSSLPGLTWASEDNRRPLSQSLTKFLSDPLSPQVLTMQWDGSDERLLSQLSGIDFRYWEASYVRGTALACRLDPSSSILRIEPSSPMDHQLLGYFNRVIGNGVASPAKFPLRFDLPDGEWIREYFFIGRGDKSVIVWRTKSPASPKDDAYSLRFDVEPSEAQISKYREYLEEIQWNEEEARLQMKYL